MKIAGGMFTPYVHSKTSEVSLVVIREFPDIEDLEEYDYPLPDDENELVEPIDYDYLASTLCADHHDWPGGVISHGALNDKYKLLNLFVSSNLEPLGHTFDINRHHGYLLFAIGQRKRVNLPLVIFNGMLKTLNAEKNSTVPYGVLITQVLMSKRVTRQTREDESLGSLP